MFICWDHMNPCWRKMSCVSKIMLMWLSVFFTEQVHCQNYISSGAGPAHQANSGVCPVGCRVRRFTVQWEEYSSTQSSGCKEISAEGRRVTGVEEDFGSKHKGSRGGVMVEGKGEGRRRGGGGESASLSFVVQMLLGTVMAEEASWLVGWFKL